MTHGTTPRHPAGEPAISGAGVPADVLQLLGLRHLEGLRDDQVRGQDCVWCGTPLTAETAVDYGEQLMPLSEAADSARMRSYPRACRLCTRTRAYSALLDHTPSCEDGCRETPGCEVGRALNRLIREGRR